MSFGANRDSQNRCSPRSSSDHETHLVTPTKVTTDGLIGNFDTLRVALEHIRTHGPDRTLLSIQAPGEELQFSDGALLALLEGFTVWLHEAGLLDIEDAPVPASLC
jgi:hypothetical protein